MNKFVLACVVALGLSSCATEAETRAALTGAALGAAAAVLVDQSSESSNSTHATHRHSGDVEEEHGDRSSRDDYHEREDD